MQFGTNKSNSKEKIHINVVVIGHVDSGKSTTTGKPQHRRAQSRKKKD